MSYKRDQLVANEALYGRALEAGLQHHMRALPYDMERVLRGRHWNTGEEAARAQVSHCRCAPGLALGYALPGPHPLLPGPTRYGLQIKPMCFYTSCEPDC